MVDGSTITTPFMNGKFDVELADISEEGVRLVTLPFKDSSEIMTILLPVQKAGETPGAALARIESALSGENLERWLSVGSRKSCLISLPRFDFTSRTALIPPLARAGLKTPFTSGQADFSKMTESKAFYISTILQTARIKMDEHGVEASAATLASITVKSVERPVEFLVKQPSIALLRDKTSGRLLFAARLAAPQSGPPLPTANTEAPGDNPPTESNSPVEPAKTDSATR